MSRHLIAAGCTVPCDESDKPKNKLIVVFGKWIVMRGKQQFPHNFFILAVLLGLFVPISAFAVELSVPALSWDGINELSIPIRLSNGTDTAPAALSFHLQWGDAPFTLVEVDTGGAAMLASKEVMRHGTEMGVRVLLGAVNDTYIEDGIVAKIRVSGPGSQESTQNFSLSFDEVSAAASDATRVPATGNGATLSLVKADAVQGDLEVDLDTLLLAYDSPSSTFTVSNSGTQSLSWSVSSEMGGINISPTSGTDETEVTVTTTDFSDNRVVYLNVINNTNASDTESITVTIDKMPPPADLDVSTNQITLTESAPTSNFNIVNLGGLPLSWTAESDTASVTVAPASGTNAAQLTITASDFTQDLTANIKLTNTVDSSDTETVVVTVEHTPLPGNLGVSSTMMNLTEASPWSTFNIINEGELPLRWTVVSDSGIVTVDPASGTGETEVKVTASNFDRDRTANLTVTNFDDESDTETVVVEISGPPEPGDLEVSTNALTLTEAANTGNFNIINGGDLPLNWTVSSDTTSVTVSASSGTGATEIFVTANDFTEDLTATITVANADNANDTETIVVQVTGTPTPSNLSVSTTMITLTTDAPSSTFNVLNNGEATLNWSALSDNEVVTVNPTSGTGETMVTVSASDFSTELTVNITLTNTDNNTDTETVVVQVQPPGKGSTGCAPSSSPISSGIMGDFILLAALLALLLGGKRLRMNHVKS